MPDKMLSLATRFPTLAACPLTTWDAHAFDAWAVGPQATAGSMHAARFVLAVWNAQGAWKVGRFDAVDALAGWDAEHRAAFVDWASAPWFP